MRYLLDANIFIQAKNLHYGFDFCPAFWQWLIAQNAAGQVASIEKVSDELAGGGDELSDWAAARGKEFFLPPDDTVLPALGEVSAWAKRALKRFHLFRDAFVPPDPTLFTLIDCVCNWAVLNPH